MAQVTKNNIQKAILTILATTGAKTTSELLLGVKELVSQTSYGKEIYRGETTRFEEKFYNIISNNTFSKDKKGRTLVEIARVGQRKKIFAITPQGRLHLKKIF